MAFKPQPLYTPGNSGVNILSKHLQFRAECFNLTNTPNFANPNAALGNAVFGPVSNLNVFANPRQYQFALKLLF